MIIPIHKPGKPANSPAPFYPIFLTSYITKLFKWLVLNCPCFFLVSKYLLSPTRPAFDLVGPWLSQSICDDFQNKRRLDRTVLATFDFFKAFNSIWHSAHFHKISGFRSSACFVCWTWSFLSNRRVKILFCGARSRSFQIRRGVSQGHVLGPLHLICWRPC